MWESDGLRSYPSSVTYWLCYLEEVTSHTSMPPCLLICKMGLKMYLHQRICWGLSEFSNYSITFVCYFKIYFILLCIIAISLNICLLSHTVITIKIQILILFVCFSELVISVQFSRSVMSNSLRPDKQQHARPPCPSQTPRVHPNPCPSSQWCHPTISCSVVPFSSCPQSFPTSGSFQKS